jgi:DNA-binding winged helix-turn-helix (wHTH) protein
MKAATVPMMRSGIDRLPTACTACGSHLLTSEPPIGKARFGTIECVACGRVLAYTLPPPRRFSAPPPRPTPASPASGDVPSADTAWRLVGCDDRCTRARHDPLAHEAYGRLLGAADRRAARRGQAVCGPLAVDYDHQAVLVDGASIGATPVEFALLARLTQSAGRVVANGDLIFDVWGFAYDGTGAALDAQALGLQNAHLLRVHMARLRPKLGSARHLLRTIPAVGYVLDAATPANGSP